MRAFASSPTPSDTLPKARAKASAYLRNGVRLVVLIEPRSRLVELHRTDSPVSSHLGADSVSIGLEMPGFTLDIAAIVSSMDDP